MISDARSVVNSFLVEITPTAAVFFYCRFSGPDLPYTWLSYSVWSSHIAVCKNSKPVFRHALTDTPGFIVPSRILWIWPFAEAYVVTASCAVSRFHSKRETLKQWASAYTNKSMTRLGTELCCHWFALLESCFPQHISHVIRVCFRLFFYYQHAYETQLD